MTIFFRIENAFDNTVVFLHFVDRIDRTALTTRFDIDIQLAESLLTKCDAIARQTIITIL